MLGIRTLFNGMKRNIVSSNFRNNIGRSFSNSNFEQSWNANYQKEVPRNPSTRLYTQTYDECMEQIRTAYMGNTTITTPSPKYNLSTPDIKLVSYSQPAEQFTLESPEVDDVQELIAFCARVSNPSNQINSATSEKLIRYLIKHQHWSPLEMVSACLEINTTRDIARQVLRHRSFSFQEFSQRYADTNEFDEQFVIREARLQDKKNRQNSIDTDDNSLVEWWYKQQEELINKAGEIYKEALDRGIAKEQARAVLPEGNTKSRLYMNGTIRSWIHYIELRQANGTQKEHMEIAKICANLISDIFPFASELLDDEV